MKSRTQKQNEKNRGKKKWTRTHERRGEVRGGKKEKERQRRGKNRDH